MFTSIVLGIDMEIAGRVERVESTLEDAKQYCLVLNSLRVPVVIETQIHTPDDDRTVLPYGAPSYVGDRISAFLSRNPSIRRSASVLFLEKIRPTSSRSR